MKKTGHLKCAILLCTIFLCACSNDEPLPPEIQDYEYIKNRTVEEIVETASAAYSALYGEHSRCNTTVKKITPINYGRSRSTLESSFFAIDFENGGYALIDADPTSDPVLAVVEYGEYVPDDPHIQTFINTASIRKIAPPNPGIGIDTTHINFRFKEEITDTLEYKCVEPQMPVWWGQNGFYAQYCPNYDPTTLNGATGCAATAMAMCMAYREQPQSILLTFDNRNEIMDLNWSEIKKHKYSVTNCQPGTNWIGSKVCYASEESHRCIAKIMRECGHRAKSQYLADAAKTYSNYFLSALQNLGITQEGIFSYLGAKYHVSQGSVLVMLGEYPNYLEHPDHIFIIDGVRHIKYRTTENIYEINGPFKRLISTSQVDFVQTLSHVVWGHDNSGVGYFNDAVLCPSRPYCLDNEAEETNYIYSDYYHNLKFITVNNH